LTHTSIDISIEEDISYIAENMREADLMEIQALGVPDPRMALTHGFEHSKPNCYSGYNHGVPVTMFGVTPHAETPQIGFIWLLGTDRITTDIPISFLKKSKRFLPVLVEPYDMVCNIVDKRNTVHIKWMKWLGFSFVSEIIYGPEKRPFYEFAKIKG